MRYRILLGAAISLACLVLVFRGVNLPSLGAAFAAVDYRWAVPTVLLVLAILLLRALRWRILLAPVRTVALLPLTSATSIGFMANNLLPLRMGEVARAAVLARRTGLPVSTILASLVLERAFDLLTILSALALVLIVDPPGGGEGAGLMKAAGAASLAALVIALGSLVLLERSPELCRRLTGFLHRISPRRWQEKIDQLAGSFVEGLRVLRSVGHLAAVLGMSLAVWACYVAAIVCLFTGLGLSLGPLAPLTVMVAISLGVLAPSTPGFVGTFHAAAVGAMLLYGVQEDAARVFAVLYHGFNYLPVVAAGLCFLSWEGLNLRELRKR